MLDRLSTTCDPEIVERVLAARKRLDAERLKILVVGEFSRGKSTFINALIGKPVLPSKVNPTTATINILQGGSPPEAIVEYQDNHQESLELPEERINRFLDGIVTTANEKAHAIRVVHIRMPGRLERLQADLVDTPGVNDLDQAREEITFKYLREADAAVMLLDAHQPLSESERIFLQQKVIGSDVHRVVFVLNKIDEVIANGGAAQAERIRQYVAQRLQEYLGIKQPEVHAVSSKNALRARFHGESDSTTPFAFESFESRLIQFAGEQATTGRLGDHLDRLYGLLEAQRTVSEEKIACLSIDLREIEGYLATLEENRRALFARLAQLDTRIERARRELAERISDHCRSLIHQMKKALTEKLQACANEDDIENFRQELSAALRDLTVKLETLAHEESERVLQEIESDFHSVLEAPSALVLARGSAGIQLYTGQSMPVINSPTIRPSEEFGLKDAAVGFGLGYLGASLFGPIGIAAAIVGTYMFGKAKREQREAELARQAREQMINSLHESCNSLADRAQGFGEEIASRESQRLMESLRERARNKETVLRTSTDSLVGSKTQSKVEKDALREETQLRLNQLQEIFDEYRSFKEKMIHA